MHLLFGAPDSGALAIDAALRLCELPFRRVRAAPWEPGPGLEQLARVNPLRQIPTLLLPGGEVMTESAAVLIHLGLSVPESELLPAAPEARARALRGLVFIAAQPYAAVGVDDYPERWTTATEAAALTQVQQAARAQLYRSWERFADAFMPAGAAQAWLGGASLGALDILAAVVSRWSGAREHLAEHRPALLELLARIDEHPVLRAAEASDWPEPC
jgi:GST-like protein